MKKLLLIFLLLMTYNIKCKASEETLGYNNLIPTETIVASSTEELEIVEDEPEQPLCREVTIANHNGMKTWMPYNKFSEDSQQYILQEYAETNAFGFRRVDGRYLCAIGTGADVLVGQYIDVVLKNGKIIPCMVGDVKAPQDTNADNLTTSYSGCVCEFIVDKAKLLKAVKISGDVSSISDFWDSPVEKIIVYDEINFLGENN